MTFNPITHKIFNGRTHTVEIVFEDGASPFVTIWSHVGQGVRVELDRSEWSRLMVNSANKFLDEYYADVEKHKKENA